MDPKSSVEEEIENKEIEIKDNVSNLFIPLRQTQKELQKEGKPNKRQKTEELNSELSEKPISEPIGVQKAKRVKKPTKTAEEKLLESE